MSLKGNVIRVNVVRKLGFLFIRRITVGKRVFEGTLANLQRFLKRFKPNPYTP
jgi:hypothetical protein